MVDVCYGDRKRGGGDLSQGATGGDGFVSQLCTLLNVEATGIGIGRVLVKVSLNPKANYDMLVSAFRRSTSNRKASINERRETKKKRKKKFMLTRRRFAHEISPLLFFFNSQRTSIE